eukprot:scaffold803_cov310-Pinguiococcus_pyrenoidosus.AAC.97
MHAIGCLPLARLVVALLLFACILTRPRGEGPGGGDALRRRIACVCGAAGTVAVRGSRCRRRRVRSRPATVADDHGL